MWVRVPSRVTGRLGQLRARGRGASCVPRASARACACVFQARPRTHMYCALCTVLCPHRRSWRVFRKGLAVCMGGWHLCGWVRHAPTTSGTAMMLLRRSLHQRWDPCHHARNAGRGPGRAWLGRRQEQRGTSADQTRLRPSVLDQRREGMAQDGVRARVASWIKAPTPLMMGFWARVPSLVTWCLG